MNQQQKHQSLSLFFIIIGLTLCFFSNSILAKDLVIYGASGNFGSDIVKEALNRGHKVTGVSRTPDQLAIEHPNFTAVKGDVTDLNSVLNTIKDADAVIMSLRGNGTDNSAEETATYKGAATYIEAAITLGADAPRVLQVGNQATLYNDGALFFDRSSSRYGEGSALYGRVRAHLLIIDLYEAEPSIKWTLFAPSGSIGPGERKGTYKIGNRQIEGRGTGISQQDFAIAFIDEVENPQAIQKVVSIGY